MLSLPSSDCHCHQGGTILEPLMKFIKRVNLDVAKVVTVVGEKHTMLVKERLGLSFYFT